MEAPILSVIIPVYNSEKTIDACITSVLHQTVHNVEAVVVDDGSSDRSQAIIRRLAETDKRVRFYPAPHGGVSSARNFGIEHASGTWITFLDSDDTLDENCARQFLNAVGQENTVYAILWPISAVDARDPILEKGKCVLRRTSEMSGAITNEWQGYIGGKLFKREIIDCGNVRFRSGISYAEDTLFAMDYLLQCDSEDFIALGNTQLYHYAISESGLRLSNPKKLIHLPLLWDQLKAYIDRQSISERDSERLEGWYQKRVLETELSVACSYPRASERYRAIRKAMGNKTGRRYLEDALKGRSCSTGNRILMTGNPLLYFLYQEGRRIAKR